MRARDAARWPQFLRVSGGQSWRTGRRGASDEAEKLLCDVLVSWRSRDRGIGAGVAASIPRGADGTPDFSGIWQTLSAADYDLEPHSTRKDAPPGPGIVDGQFIPYRPEAVQQRQKNFEARAAADPRSKCFTLALREESIRPNHFRFSSVPGT